MKFSTKIIEELIKYKKGEIIPNPDIILRLGLFPLDISRILNTKIRNLTITRRSIAHILQKEKVGIFLLNSMMECLNSFDLIFISDKGKLNNTKRYLVFKRNIQNNNSVAVVIEIAEGGNNIFVVTIMIADEKYLCRKYKKLR